jgi:hypothetical protein
MNKLINKPQYAQFRWCFTSNGNLVVGGKSDEQNEKVLMEFSKPSYVVCHTTEPGSPFMIIVGEKIDKSDIEEAAIFCACFSKQWKLSKNKIDIDIFKREQVYKLKKMKTGTFGVKGKVEKMSVSPELVLVIQKGKIRAVPKTTKEEIICKIIPGNLKKEEACKEILKIIKNKYHLPISKDEVMAAIPSDRLEVK